MENWVGRAKGQTDCFCMPYVQVAVGLWWEASAHATPVPAAGQVLLYEGLEEVEAAGLFGLVLRHDGAR